MDRINRARKFRKEPSLCERILWKHLRDRQLDGWNFRRQHPIGRFVADFVCLEAHLIIEADGGQHRLREEADRKRDAWLAQEGYRVLRIRDADIFSRIDVVLKRISETLAANHPSPPAPSPPRGEGRRL